MAEVLVVQFEFGTARITIEEGKNIHVQGNTRAVRFIRVLLETGKQIKWPKKKYQRKA